MKLNKKVAKTLIFALGLGVASLLGSFGSKVYGAQQPADVVADKIEFDGNKGIINVKDESKATLWGFAKELKNEKGANFKKGGKFYKITDIDDVHDKIVDISSFYGKKVILAFGSVNNLDIVTETSSANGKWTVKEIHPADNSFNIGYISSIGEKFGKLDVTTDQNTIASDYGVLAAYHIVPETKTVEGLNPNSKEAFYEVRQGEGEWMAIKKGAQAPADTNYLFEDFTKDKLNPKFRMLIQNGSTLYFRLKATENAWPGDARKVTFKKQPNAPKITLDPLKDSSNVKYGMKVMLKKDTSTSDPEVEKPISEGTKKASFTELGIEEITAEKTGTLTIYTDATKGKVQSKKTVLTLTRPADMTFTSGGDGNNKKLKESSGSYTAEGQEVDIIEGKLTLKLKVAYDLTKGAELISKDTQNDYEYYIEYSDNANDNKVKWSKLKKAKSDRKPSKASLKYSKDSKPFTYGDSNSKLYIRIASTKQNGNVMMLPSLKKAVKVNLTNITQSMTASGEGGVTASFQNSGTNTISIQNITKGKDKTYKVTLTMAGRQNVKSPKIKIIEKANGVSVKAGKFNGENKAILDIKVSKNTFPKEGTESVTLKFTYTAESLKDKEVTVTLSPASN